MNIIENVEIIISEKDIEDLIHEELKRKDYKIVGNISINLKTETGFGMRERDKTLFKNITCKAKLINS